MVWVVKHAACAQFGMAGRRFFTPLQITTIGMVVTRLSGNACTNVPRSADRIGIMAGTSAVMTSHTCTKWIHGMDIALDTASPMGTLVESAEGPNVQNHGAQT